MKQACQNVGCGPVDDFPDYPRHLCYQENVGQGKQLYAFWKDRKLIASTLSARSPGLKLVEFDDGVINYSLGIPSVHGTGFVLDYQGYLASKNGRFLVATEGDRHLGFECNTSVMIVRTRLRRNDLCAEKRSGRGWGI